MSHIAARGCRNPIILSSAMGACVTAQDSRGMGENQWEIPALWYSNVATGHSLYIICIYECVYIYIYIQYTYMYIYIYICIYLYHMMSLIVIVRCCWVYIPHYRYLTIRNVWNPPWLPCTLHQLGRVLC